MAEMANMNIKDGGVGNGPKEELKQPEPNAAGGGGDA